MVKVVVLCDWLPPDFGAVGQYAIQSARELAARGNCVTLIGFSSRKGSITTEHVVAGVLRVVRLQRKPYDRSKLAVRAFWTIGANIALVRSAWTELRSADEVHFTGSPPYLLHFIMPVAKMLGVRTRYRIADFHPECLMAALGREPLSLRAVLWASRFWRRRVDTIEVLGEDQRRRIIECGVAASRVTLVRDASPIEFPAAGVSATPPPALRGRKIILYSGNWGVAHDHQTFVDAFDLFSQQYPQAAGVWLNATGAKADAVQDELQRRGLCFARTAPVALSELAGVLLAADLHLITLLDAFVGYVLPSKVYACAASGKPILFIGSDRSDVDLICLERAPPGFYERAEVGDVHAAVRGMERLLLRAERSSSIEEPLELHPPASTRSII